MKTTSKLPGTEGVVKEAGLVFHRDILSKVQKYSIPNKLILNLGQTSPKEVSVDKTALVKKILNLSQLLEYQTNALSLQHSLYHAIEFSF